MLASNWFPAAMLLLFLSFIPYLLVRYWQQLQMRRSTRVPCTFHLASNSLGTRLVPTWLFNACRSNLSDITSSLSRIRLSCSCLSLSFSSIVQWCYEGCPTRAETYSWETRLVCTSNSLSLAGCTNFFLGGESTCICCQHGNKITAGDQQSHCQPTTK